MPTFGMRMPKHKKSRKPMITPIVRRPSYQHRHLMKNVSQSIQAHINRLAQPVVRNPVSQSPFAFLQQRLRAVEKRQPKRMIGFRLPRKQKRRKIKKHSETTKSAKHATQEVRVANMQQQSQLILPAHLSATIANFEKARLSFLESLSQIQKQIANLKLPGPIREPVTKPSGLKLPPKKTVSRVARPKAVFPQTQVSAVKLTPPTTKGLSPRPQTPMKQQLNNIQHLLGPKLRDMMAKATNSNLPSWIT